MILNQKLKTYEDLGGLEENYLNSIFTEYNQQQSNMIKCTETNEKKILILI